MELFLSEGEDYSSTTPRDKTAAGGVSSREKNFLCAAAARLSRCARSSVLAPAGREQEREVPSRRRRSRGEESRARVANPVLPGRSSRARVTDSALPEREPADLRRTRCSRSANGANLRRTLGSRSTT